MDGVKDFPPDFSKSFAISFTYFRRCHVGFLQDLPFGRKYWRLVILSVVALFNLASVLLYTIRMFGKINISELAFMVATSVIGIQSVLKAAVILPETKDLEDLVRGIGKMWKTENLNDVQTNMRNRHLKQLNLGLSVIYWGTTLALIQNLAPPLFTTVINKIHQEDYDLILPFGYVYPFDPVKNWGRYLLTYAMQAYSIVMLIYYYLGVTCLVMTLLSHLSTEFAILREDIKHAVPVPNTNNITQYQDVDQKFTIAAMIKNHQELLKLAELLNKIFNRMVFFDLCCYAVITGFFAVMMMVTRDPLEKLRFIVSVLCMLVTIFLFCYYCEALKEESADIAQSAYENPWYEGGTQYQKSIRFIIMRSQRPCYLTSLNYAPIDLTTFTKVISTTWTYFSLAMTMVNK